MKDSAQHISRSAKLKKEAAELRKNTCKNIVNCVRSDEDCRTVVEKLVSLMRNFKGGIQVL